MFGRRKPRPARTSRPSWAHGPRPAHEPPRPGAPRRSGPGRLVTALLAAGLLAALGGCSGDDGRPDAKPSAPAAPPPRTERQLTAALLADGEKAGRYIASDHPLGGPLDADYTAAPRVCQPLVSLAPGVSGFEPVAEAGRRADIPEETLGTTVDVRLRSYAGQRATRVMKALAAAGRRCAGGFTEDRTLARAPYLKVERIEAPDLGDQALAYRFTILDVRGRKRLYEYLTVVRSGSTTLSFRAGIVGTHDIGGVPEEVIRAQWEKFTAS